MPASLKPVLVKKDAKGMYAPGWVSCPSVLAASDGFWWLWMKSKRRLSLGEQATDIVITLLLQFSLAHFFSPESQPRVKYWIGKQAPQQGWLRTAKCRNLCKHSGAQKAGLKPPPNAPPGKVTSPKDVMTDRKEAKALKPVEIMEQDSDVILQ